MAPRSQPTGARWSRSGVEVEAGPRAATRAQSGVRAVPMLRDADPKPLRDVLGQLADGGTAASALERADHVLATMACHSVVRAGDVLGARRCWRSSHSSTASTCRHCPHGRPVCCACRCPRSSGASAGCQRRGAESHSSPCWGRPPPARARSASTLAQRLNGEIVACDSLQIYGRGHRDRQTHARGQRQVPHHLLDLANPNQPFHAARWAERRGRHLRHRGARARANRRRGHRAHYRALAGRALVDAPAPTNIHQRHPRSPPRSGSRRCTRGSRP